MMNVYLVTGHVRHGQDDHVVIAESEEAAIAYVHQGSPFRRGYYRAEQIGTAVPNRRETETILSSTWRP